MIARFSRACKWGAIWPRHPVHKLLDFDRRHAFELLPDGLGLILGRVLLQRLGCAIDQVLGFLQAERSDFAYSLDGVDLVSAGILQDDLKFGLLLNHGSRR